jgi:hypothetical protein
MRPQIRGCLATLCAIGFALSTLQCGGACTLIGCENSVSWTGTVAVSASDLPMLTITVCCNESCSAGSPAPGLFSVALNGPLAVTCSLTPPSSPSAGSSTPYAMSVDAHPTQTVAWTDDSAAPPVSVSKSVTYTKLSRNGVKCGPTCLTASLD